MMQSASFLANINIAGWLQVLVSNPAEMVTNSFETVGFPPIDKLFPKAMHMYMYTHIVANTRAFFHLVKSLHFMKFGRSSTLSLCLETML